MLVQKIRRSSSVASLNVSGQFFPEIFCKAEILCLSWSAANPLASTSFHSLLGRVSIPSWCRSPLPHSAVLVPLGLQHAQKGRLGRTATRPATARVPLVTSSQARAKRAVVLAGGAQRAAKASSLLFFLSEQVLYFVCKTSYLTICET